ncbi:hypothetical protein [Microlunatus parietis]|uniref:Uncharacterized protein n=1 Tax=Microlunatus parietis TaxID=682979 RepID=A0A7Y9LDF3_9ACTN|nr:hypothetical protein [Microlunatus parietis]NYE71866.1 hypothetical protein [Microlunatus parietis]
MITETTFAALVSDRATADAMLGDLVEERSEIAAERGESAARRWYRWELIRSAPALVWRRMREAPVPVLLWALLGLLIIGAVAPVIGMAIELLQQVITGPTPYTDLFVPLAIGHLVGGVAAGGIVGRLSRRAPLATAVWVALAWIAWLIISVVLSPVAVWMLLTPVGSVTEVNLAGRTFSIVAGVPDLLVIIGVLAGGFAVTLRSAPGPRTSGRSPLSARPPH